MENVILAADAFLLYKYWFYKVYRQIDCYHSYKYLQDKTYAVLK